MKPRIGVLVLCGVIALLPSACATKKFVREHVGETETKLGQRVETQQSQLTQRIDTQDTKLRETTDRTAANTQAIEATGQRLRGLDTRLGEVDASAADAKKQAETVAGALQETRGEFTQRFANRNTYAELQTKAIYFDFNKADLRDEGINELQDVAQALKADPNAVLELQGFADPRGTDRYNYQLTRERVDAVVRHLVQRHGIDLRRIHAVGMGKEGRAAGEKATREAHSKSRRVDIRLLAPQS